jgi:MOSC domain-containing protein YiiM
MREPGDLPPDVDTLAGSGSACLAAILELDAAEVRHPGGGHPDPWTVWGNWLAERGLGLVPIADPAGFAWPGPWLAVLRGEGRRVCAVAYGPPSTLVWHPLGGPETFADVEAGYVVAPADVALWSPPVRESGRTTGRVEAIAIAAEAEAEIELVDSVLAVSGRGLAGDRYHDGAGTFSNRYGVGHELTLVEAEVLEELGFTAQDARRNVVTRGIDLNALVGKRFTVGEVECVGRRLCEPCAHLQRLSPGTLRPLVHRGGLRADLLGDGAIRVGDPVSA